MNQEKTHDQILEILELMINDTRNVIAACDNKEGLAPAEEQREVLRYKIHILKQIIRAINF